MIKNARCYFCIWFDKALLSADAYLKLKSVVLNQGSTTYFDSDSIKMSSLSGYIFEKNSIFFAWSVCPLYAAI